MIDLAPMKGHPRRSDGAHRARAGRRAVEGAEPRDAGARPGDHRRRRLEHGHRRPDAGRRPRLADAEVRARARQPAVGRNGAWPTAASCAPAPTRTRICSGRSAAAAATSASPRRSSTPCIRSGRSSTAGSSRIRAEGRRRAAVLPRHVRVAARRGDAGGGTADGAGRLRRQAGRPRRLPLRIARRRRSGAAADQGSSGRR